MNIAVCDDLKSDREETCGLLNKYIESNNISASIYVFSSGEEFLSSSKMHFDVVFMDICMNGIDGIEAAKQYPDKTSKFVFTTTSPDFSLKAFSVNVAHYLLKPVTYENITDAMQRCFPQQMSGYVYLKSNKHTVPVLQQDIVYIEVFNNTVVVHTPAQSIAVRTPLKSIYDMLNHNVFIQPQRSYVVNMYHIDSFTTDSIRLTDGNEIFMSREQKAKTIATYEAFLFSRIRKGNKENDLGN